MQDKENPKPIKVGAISINKVVSPPVMVYIFRVTLGSSSVSAVPVESRNLLWHWLNLNPRYSFECN